MRFTCFASMLALLLPLQALQAGDGGGSTGGEEPGASSGDARNASEKASPRLRFRRGPVCMCAGGLTEKEIREAEERRRGESGDPEN